MNKTIVTIVAIIVIIAATIIGYSIYNSTNQKAEEQEGEIFEIAEETILDDCTDEYEEMQSELVETNANTQVKISPNASITFKTYYEKCGHTTSEYKNIPTELVNKAQEELQEIYKDWEVEDFSDTDIVLTTKKQGECGEHYIVKNNEGKITVYNVLEDGSEKEYEVTDISTEYLPDSDKVNMQNGIRINGKQNLNQLIEDFE